MLKKITILSVLLLTSCLVFGSVSYAAVSVGFAECTILKTHSTGSKVVLKLTAVNGAFENIWITLSDNLNNYGLATAFTAMAMDKNITVEIGDESGYKIIAIGLVNE